MRFNDFGNTHCGVGDQLLIAMDDVRFFKLNQ